MVGARGCTPCLEERWKIEASHASLSMLSRLPWPLPDRKYGFYLKKISYLLLTLSKKTLKSL